MTTTTYGNIGIGLCWFGGLATVAAIIFFVMVSRGISTGDPNHLHLHDTYHIVLNWGHRLVLLLPVVAGIFIGLSGQIIRSHAHSITAELSKIQQVDQDDGSKDN